MGERTGQRELADVDTGMAAAEVLRRTADAERQQLEQALAELGAALTDEEILSTYGLDMAEMRRDVDWGWSLP